MSDYYSSMMESFPHGLEPPEPIQWFFKWQAVVGLAERSGLNGSWLASVDPSRTGSPIYTSPVDAGFSQSWLGIEDPAATQRLAIFCTTGGDGSRAGLWLDELGQIQFVHLGSGSGSTMFGVLTSDPVDFLRLLAIGYDELCWPEQYDQTPDEVFAEYQQEDEGFVRPERPKAIQGWVEHTFGLAVPSKASEIIAKLPTMDDAISNDPFWIWDRSFPKWQG